MAVAYIPTPYVSLLLHVMEEEMSAPVYDKIDFGHMQPFPVTDTAGTM